MFRPVPGGAHPLLVAAQIAYLLYTVVNDES
jgi:hypothetical protein